MLPASPVQQTALHAGIPPGRGRPRIWGVWGRRRWFDIVLAVQPEPLDHFECVLFMLVYVRVRGFEERRWTPAPMCSSASTDHSHWRQEIVIWVSTSLAMAPPQREVLASEFIRVLSECGRG